MSYKSRVFEFLEIATNNILLRGHINDDNTLEVAIDEMKNLLLSLHLFLIDGLIMPSICYWNLIEIVFPNTPIDSLKKTSAYYNYNEICVYWLLSAIQERTLSSLITILSNEFDLLRKTYSNEALIYDHDKLDQLIITLQSNVESNPIIIKGPTSILITKTLNDLNKFLTNGYEYLARILHESSENNNDELEDTSTHADSHIQEVVNESLSNEASSVLFLSMNQSNGMHKINDINKTTHFNICSTPSLGTKNSNYKDELIEAMNSNDEIMDDEIYARMGLSKSLIDQDFNSEFMGFSAEEELINSINACKNRISSTEITLKEKEKLVKLLIQLRWKLYNHKNTDSIDFPSSKNNLGHLFTTFTGKYISTCGPNYQRKIQCEACHKTLQSIFTKILSCRKCNIIIHGKCVNNLPVPCIKTQINNLIINYKICPEIGLSKQSFRCGFCKVLLFNQKSIKPKKCDYSGLYYCSLCHTDDLHMIPARIIRNWDFKCYPVSRYAFILLQLIWNKSVFDLLKLSSNLIEMVPNIKKVQEQRKHLTIFKYYLEACKFAIKNKIYQELEHRLYLLDDDTTYTFADLTQIYDGKLIKLLQKMQDKFIFHIKKQCQICHDLGHFCLICRSSDSLYPFDTNIIICPKCNGIFHKSCYDPLCCITCTRLSTYTTH